MLYCTVKTRMQYPVWCVWMYFAILFENVNVCTIAAESLIYSYIYVLLEKTFHVREIVNEKKRKRNCNQGVMLGCRSRVSLPESLCLH